MLRELRRTLDVSGAPPIGFVLIETDAEQRQAYAGFYRLRGARGVRS